MSSKMRIAMIAPIEVRVPPVAYGGTELVVSILTEELIRLGHDVTLFASGDSITRANLVSIVPQFLWRSCVKNSSSPLSLLNVIQALERAENFDIIHNHTSFEGLATAGLIKTPVLTTLHGGLDRELLTLFKYYKGWYNTISKSAKSLLPPKGRFAGVIYNAIDCAAYPFNSGERDDYLLYLSRLSPQKGTHLAIEVAQKLKRRLIIAGSVHSVDRDYFVTQILPHIDGKMIIYEREVSNMRKKELLANAQCLLAPITWPEPFGLFMVEAMACGTPVIAMNRGSANEIVFHGKTGFLVNSIEEMIDAIQKVDEIDPWTCRQRVMQYFNAPVMTNNYLQAYRQIIEEKDADMIKSRLIVRK
jgi:glycosyltransferase involved in cell wall biosynthesis